MSKEIYLIVQNFNENKHIFTYEKGDLKKTQYEFYLKFVLINEKEIELLSTVKYTDNLQMSYRIILELLKKNYGLFEKHHKVKLVKSIDLTKDIINQLEKNNMESYITPKKTISVDILMKAVAKLLGK
jgi:hypothetical protein